MRYLSVCSGIEAASVAWHPLGWTPAAFSEIDPFPRAVLAHHYPDVPLHGDFTTIGADDYGSIDVLVGGTPCQDFSVAGLRAGIAGDRGNLTLEFLRLAARTKPRWIVWENVPGVLSSDEGRALGAFLGGLAELGYGFAHRVLDAQYFNLAQRRARVFVVGYLGDWRRAAAVLFERESLLGHPAPRREAGEGVASPIAAGSPGGSGYRNDADTADNLIAAPVGSFQQNSMKGRGTLGWSGDGEAPLRPVKPQPDHQFIVMASGQSNAPVFENDQCPALTCLHEAPIIAHTLSTQCAWATEDGTGRGSPLVAHAFDARQSDVIQYGDMTGPLDTDGHTIGVLAFSVKDHGADTGPISPTLRAGGFNKNHANGGVMPAVAFDLRGREGGAQFEGPHDTANIRAASSGSSRSYVAAMQVRRLTPMECERLQGFPDDYTLVPYRNKPASDGPRYKALGNSMAVPCMAWIGQRIAMIETLIAA